MSEPDTDTLERPGDEELAAHLRRTLHAVADAVILNDAPVTGARAGPVDLGATRRRRRWRVAVPALAAVVALSLVAWNRFGPGEIERIPVEAAILHGTAPEGGQWWLISSQAVHPRWQAIPSSCAAAVEFVSAAANRPGAEWNTGGVAYGESSGPASCYDESGWLADPTQFSMGSTRLGNSDDSNTAWGYFAAVHPKVATIEVFVDEAAPFVVDTQPLPDRPNGPRFTAFTVPADTVDVLVRLHSADGATLAERSHSPVR
jgi:hypothetical protein